MATMTNLFDLLALDSGLHAMVKRLVVISAVALDAFTQSRRT